MSQICSHFQIRMRLEGTGNDPFATPPAAITKTPLIESEIMPCSSRFFIPCRLLYHSGENTTLWWAVTTSVSSCRSRSTRTWGALVWSPLGWARLTGKIRRGQPLPQVCRLPKTADGGPPVPDDHLHRVVDAIDAIAQETGKTAAQIALNWLLRLKP